MEARIEIIKGVFSQLRRLGIAHTQKDIATQMGVTVETVSRAFKGNKKYLTDSFLCNLNKSFSYVFNEEWLLTGSGEILADEPRQTPTPQAQIQDTIIQYPLSELNRKNAEIDELKAKLDARDKMIELLEKRLEQKDKKIDGLNEQLLKSSDSTTTGESKLANVG